MGGQMHAMLESLLKRWKREGLDVLPPYGEAVVRATFLEAGIEAPKDLTVLYGVIGGIDVPDQNNWCLWPLSEVYKRRAEANGHGVIFSDYLLDSWLYRIKPNDTETSAVYVDYFDGREPFLVARSLKQFIEMYLANPMRLMEAEH